MDFDRSRLRRGELIVAAGAIFLLASMLLLKWYRLGPTSVDGWTALAHIRWLVLVTILAGLALFMLQAMRRAPAIPATLGVIVTVLGILTVVALVYRVVVAPVGGGDRGVGGFVALASAIAFSYGGYRSMREEGVSLRDAPGEIETVELEHMPQ